MIKHKHRAPSSKMLSPGKPKYVFDGQAQIHPLQSPCLDVNVFMMLRGVPAHQTVLCTNALLLLLRRSTTTGAICTRFYCSKWTNRQKYTEGSVTVLLFVVHNSHQVRVYTGLRPTTSTEDSDTIA